MNKKIIFISVISLFFFWGIANSMVVTMISAFKKIMNLSDLDSSWLQTAFSTAYFCIALPAAIFVGKFSYKSGIILGTGLFAMGCLLFIPCQSIGEYHVYLVAIFTLGLGCGILETTANPYMLSTCSPEDGARRLNLAQCFNPLGLITGILLSKYLVLNRLNEDAESCLSNVTFTYAIIAVFIIAVLIITLFTKSIDNKSGQSLQLWATFKRLIKSKKYVFGVFSEFCYVGAQTGVWCYLIPLAKKQLAVNESQASNIYLISIILFSVFRFVFTALMKKYQPKKLLLISSVCAFCCIIATVLFSGFISIVAAILISAFLSLMYPTIYAYALEDAGKDSKIGASGLVMAVVGGAVFTPLQGAVSDAFSTNTSYLVSLFCISVVMTFALYLIKSEKSKSY